MVIDSQVHIWAANTPERPWMEGMEKRAHLPTPLDADMLLGLMQEAGVDRAVIVPPSLDGDRNDLALAAAKAHPDRFAVMGRLLLDKPGAREKLDAMKTQRGMLGARLTFHRDNDRPFLTNGVADWLWPEAERLKLPVMVHAPERLPQIGAIAERHPGLTIIVDHMGFARETMDEEAKAGAERLAALARHQNVFVKVSAIPCYSTQPYPYANLHEPIRRIVDAFGPRRSIWGSDFSRLPKGASYRQSLTVLDEALPALSAEDMDWITSKTFLACVGWPT